MRCIGHLDNEEAATTFRDFLYVEGIPGHIEADSPQGWAVWVEDEDQLEPASVWLGKFLANPRDAVFKAKARVAPTLREQQEKSDAAYAKKIKARSEVFRPMILAGTGPLTLALIAVAVVVYLLMQTEPGALWVGQYLLFSSQGGGLAEVFQGQFWRLLTPIFLHFGIIHVFFNMYWLREMGGQIELRQGTGQLAALVLVLGVFSNLVQAYLGPFLVQLAATSGSASLAYSLQKIGLALGTGPLFGGMSGVNYGLLGYIWMRGRFDPGAGLFLHPLTIQWMIGWFILCFTPFLGHVANGAHLGGLLGGMAWGWLASQKYR